jgi:opacity protein-like surface antigen
MNMKKLITVALSGSVLATSAAFADFEPRFYVGADATYNHFNLDKDLKNDPDIKKVQKNRLGTNLVLGGKFHEFFGAEIGYSFIQKAKVTWTEQAIKDGEKNYNVKANNMYLDLMGFYPVSCEVDLLASVGVGRMKVKFSNGATNLDNKSSKSKTGLRGRIGAQYKFDENFAARFLVGHQKGVKAMGLKSNTSAGLGVTYTF